MHIPVFMLLKLLIDEAKIVGAFSFVSEDLVSTTEELLPIITEMESMQGVGELNNLKDTIEEARVLVRKCSDLEPWDLFYRAKYVRKIKKINERMLKFCQFQLQLILLRNQLKSMVTMKAIKSCMNQQPITNTASKFNAVIAVTGAVVSDLLASVITNKLNWSHGHFMVSKLEVSAVEGVVVSNLMTRVIKGAKKVLTFKTVFKELASTMEELLPIISEIESLQGVEELKNLKDTIERALVLVQECSEVGSWDLISKVQYTEQIEKINNKMLKFCQIQLQLIMLRNQLKSTGLLWDFIGCPQRDVKSMTIIKSHKFKFALLGLAALISILIQEPQAWAFLAWISSQISILIVSPTFLAKCFYGWW